MLFRSDILVEEGKARIYLTAPAADVVLTQLVQVGRIGVVCCEPLSWSTATKRRFTEIEGSISSLRLDCVVAFLGDLSRSGASELIARGQVSIDGQPVGNGARIVELKEKISIRGTGKFIYDQQPGLSKKGKLRVRFLKYS